MLPCRPGLLGHHGADFGGIAGHRGARDLPLPGRSSSVSSGGRSCRFSVIASAAPALPPNSSISNFVNQIPGWVAKMLVASFSSRSARSGRPAAQRARVMDVLIDGRRQLADLFEPARRVPVTPHPHQMQAEAEGREPFVQEFLHPLLGIPAPSFQPVSANGPGIGQRQPATERCAGRVRSRGCPLPAPARAGPSFRHQGRSAPCLHRRGRGSPMRRRKSGATSVRGGKARWRRWPPSAVPTSRPATPVQGSRRLREVVRPAHTRSQEAVAHSAGRQHGGAATVAIWRRLKRRGRASVFSRAVRRALSGLLRRQVTDGVDQRGDSFGAAGETRIEQVDRVELPGNT